MSKKPDSRAARRSKSPVEAAGTKISAPGSSVLTRRKDGGHKWTIFESGRVVTAGTSSSSVTTITQIGADFDQALRRLAKK